MTLVLGYANDREVVGERHDNDSIVVSDVVPEAPLVESYLHFPLAPPDSSLTPQYNTCTLKWSFHCAQKNKSSQMAQQQHTGLQ